jgi:hypothetical protein
MPNDNKITTIELLILAKIYFFNKMLINCLESHLKPKKVVPDLYEQVKFRTTLQQLSQINLNVTVHLSVPLRLMVSEITRKTFFLLWYPYETISSIKIVIYYTCFIRHHFVARVF